MCADVCLESSRTRIKGVGAEIMRSESKGMWLGLLGVTGFGFTLPVTRLVIPELDPVFIGSGRAVVAAGLAGLVLLAKRSRLPTVSQWRQLLVVAAGVVVGFPMLSAWAMQTVPASHGGVVLGVLPLATAVVGAFIMGERPSMGFWLVSLAGSATVVGYALWTGAGTLQIGDLALLGAVVSAAIGYAVGGKLTKELGGGPVICWALVISLPLIVFPAWLTAPESFAAVSGDAWLGFLYLALVSQLFGFFLWNAGLALGGIARVSQTQLLQPFVTIAASAVLLSEAIETSTVVLALIVISLVAIGRTMPVASAPRAPVTGPVCCQSRGG